MKTYEKLCQKYSKSMTKKQRKDLLYFCEKMSALSGEPSFYEHFDVKNARLGTFFGTKSIFTITHNASNTLEQIHFAICFSEDNDNESDNIDYIKMTFYQRPWGGSSDDMFIAKWMYLPLLEAFEYIQSTQTDDNFSYSWS